MTVAAALLLPPAALGQTSQPDWKVVTQEVYVAMDDGVRLAVTLGMPSKDGSTPAPGPFPGILTMTPYSKDLGGPSSYYVTRGYVHAVADIRGAGASEGNLDDNYFSPREQRDGYELVEWLGTQPWASGRVGMTGGSYLGITQYLTAIQQPPHLAAIVPSMALSDLYRDATYHGGMLSAFFGAQYLAVQGGPGLLSGLQEPSNQGDALGAKLGQAQSEPIAFDYLANTTDTGFYRERSPAYGAGRIEVPVLIYDGWFDGFIRGAGEMYRLLSRRRGVETRLWIDPVTHKGARSPQYNPQGYEASRLQSFQAASLEFLDRHLKRFKTPARPKVRLYLMGRDAYADGRRWPPRRVRYRRLWLTEGEGLSWKRPPAARAASFFTNPTDGFTNTLSRHGNMAASAYLPLDQEYERERGLVWQTGPLTKPLALIGPMSMRLTATSTAPDTDWVRISDVGADGSATLITEGYLRASHRAVDRGRSRPERPWHVHESPEPIEPGLEYTYDIEIWPTAMEFQPGHRMRVQLTSDDAPNHLAGTVTIDRADPSRVELRPNRPATNTVRLGGRSGSSLLVPVLKPLERRSRRG